MRKRTDDGLTAAPRRSDDTPGELDLSRLRVLAAEDNAINQLVLKVLLAQLGIEPTMVADGAQAVEAWGAGAFDLILMDIRMPRMDGTEATRAIRREEARTGRPRTPIIALTGDVMSDQVAEFLAIGMDAHIAKPIDRRALAAAVERLTAAPPAQDEDLPGRTTGRRAG
jgi:CheY-like chemotaxis protein